MRVPVTASPEVQEAFRSIYRVLDPLTNGRNVDLRGTRLINAGGATAEHDYTTRADVRQLVQTELNPIAQAYLEATKLTGTVLAPNVVTSSLTSVGTLIALTVAGVATVTPSANASALVVAPTHATYTSNAVFVNTTRAANAAFNLMVLQANSVTQFSVRGDGVVTGGTYNGQTISATANFTGTLRVVGDFRADAAVQFGTHSALGAETVTGFITITDSGGASRKLAVVS